MKLPRPLTILQQQHSYCKQLTQFSPHCTHDRTALFVLQFSTLPQNNNDGSGADGGAVSPTTHSIFNYITVCVCFQLDRSLVSYALNETQLSTLPLDDFSLVVEGDRETQFQRPPAKGRGASDRAVAGVTQQDQT